MPKTARRSETQSEKREATKGKELSRNPGVGMTIGQLVRQVNRFRDYYNPLRGLVISKAVSLLEASERGEFADLQLTMRKVEKRYPTLKALKANRLAAITRLDYDIKIPDNLKGADKALAEEQQEFLRQRYDLITNLKAALRFLALAEFRKFSIIQKHYYSGGPHDGAVRELHWLPQWNWVRDGMFGSWFYNQDTTIGASAQSIGEEWRIPEPEEEPGDLDRKDFIIRECEDPIYEVALPAFINWGMGRKDWAAFVEIFGLTNCVVIMPSTIPVGQEEVYKQAAVSVAEGASGALPFGADAKFPAASVRNNSPFKDFCNAQDEDVVLAGTGGKLTMLTESGSGTLAGGAHQETFDRLAEGEGYEISEVMQSDFDEHELEAEFPNQPHFAYFELYCKTARDAKIFVSNVVALEGIGLQSDVDEVSEKLGMKLTRVERPTPADPRNTPDPEGDDDDPDDPKPKSRNDDDDREDEDEPLKNRRRKIRNAARPGPSASELDQLFRALDSDLQPLRTRLERILQIEDAALFETKMREFSNDLDQLKEDLTADPEAARALEQINAAALARGLTRQR